MKLLKKMLLSLGIVVAGEIPAVAAPAEPDFAHPRKVIADAYATLRSSAGKPDEGAVRVRAVLELCAASQSIDPDSIFTLIKSTGVGAGPTTASRRPTSRCPTTSPSGTARNSARR